jgi:hypothetical protein
MASIPPTLLHTVQLVGLSTSLLLAGINIGTSHVAVPLLHRLDNNRYNPCHHRRGGRCKNRKHKGKHDDDDNKEDDEAAAAAPSYSDLSLYDGSDSKPTPACSLAADTKTPLITPKGPHNSSHNNNNNNSLPTTQPTPPPTTTTTGSAPYALAHLYHGGARASMPLAVLSALASIFVAATLTTTSTSSSSSFSVATLRHVWAAAAATALASIPFAVALGRATRRLAPRGLLRQRRGHGHRHGQFFGWRRRNHQQQQQQVEAVVAEDEALLVNGAAEQAVVAFASDEEAIRTMRRWKKLSAARTKLAFVNGLVVAWAVVFGA